MKIWERKFRDTPAGTVDAKTLLGNFSKGSVNSSQTEMTSQGLLGVPEALMGEEQAKEEATVATRLASSFIEQGKYTEAETLLWYALKISEKTLGKEDLATVYCLGNLARLYQAQKQFVFAEFLYERAQQIATVKYKLVPKGTKQIVENYIQFLKETGREHHAAELKRHFDVLRNL